MLDIGLGGMRVYSDDEFKKGSRMEIDLLLADRDDFVTCLTEVVWTRAIPGGVPAAYDLGLRFLDIPVDARTMIERLISESEHRPEA